MGLPNIPDSRISLHRHRGMPSIVRDNIQIAEWNDFRHDKEKPKLLVI